MTGRRRFGIALVALLGLVMGTAALDAAGAGASPGPRSAGLPAALDPVVSQPRAPIPVSPDLFSQDTPPAGDVSAATVFGADTRQSVADTTGQGWRTIAYLVMVDASGTPTATCSGVMLNYNVVLTAAHCIYDGGGFVAAIAVAPAETPSGPPFGAAVSTRFVVPSGWTTTCGQAGAAAPCPLSPYDFGLVFLDNPPWGNALAPYYAVASAPDSYFASNDIGLVSAGYPGDEYPQSLEWLTGNLDASMWYESVGPTGYGFDSTFIYEELDISHGQSGSPIFTIAPDHTGFIFSVVSVGPTAAWLPDGSGANTSIRFTPTVIGALNNYCAANGCSILSANIPSAQPTPSPTATSVPPSPTLSPTPAPASTPTPTPSSTLSRRGVVPEVLRD